MDNLDNLKIGFVGLGQLGYPIARNLATPDSRPNSLPILVWNRTQSKSEALLLELGEDKVKIADNLEEIATRCDVIITNLANDAAVKEVYAKFAKSMQDAPPPSMKIFVETSTLYPTFAGEMDKLISSHPNARFVACPVFGTPPVATKRQLLLSMSGDYLAKKAVAPLLVPTIARRIFDLGGSVEKGPTFKLLGNSMIIGIMEGLSESFTLAAKAGIKGDTVLDLIKDLIPAPGIVLHSTRMAHDNFGDPINFAIDGGIKDLSHISRLSVEHCSPMPVIDVALQHLLTAKTFHDSQMKHLQSKADTTIDATAIIAGSRVAAGLDPFDSSKVDMPNLYPWSICVLTSLPQHTTVANVEKES